MPKAEKKGVVGGMASMLSFKKKKQTPVVEVDKTSNSNGAVASVAATPPEPVASMPDVAPTAPNTAPSETASALTTTPTPTATAPAPASSDPGLSSVNPDEQMYELEVPPKTQPGSKLKLTIPGLAEKVVITVPEGAVPGRTISFTLPKSKLGVGEKFASQTKAATAIQARMRGKAARKNGGKEETAGTDSPARPASLPDATGAKAAPNNVEIGHAPNAAPEQPTPSSAQAASAPSFLTGLKKSFTSLFSSFTSTTGEPAVDPDSAIAFELTSVTARAISAWEAADFDSFATLALPNVAVSMPGLSAAGMTELWQVRGAEDAEGILSIDTCMAQVEDDAATVATVVAIEHSHDTEEHGMPVKHAWLRITLKREAADATWKLAELVRDPIWPLPTEQDAAPEEFRLGMGRTLGACTDVSSLASVALTSWMAGDRDRFELAVSADLSVSFVALGLDAKSAAAAWEGREKLLKLGNLLALNSPMADAGAGGGVRVLAHAHLYDVRAGDDASGRPAAHFALRLEFAERVQGALELREVVGDAIWIDEQLLGAEYETLGLSFESPPMVSIYTRALTFVKAWEMEAVETLEALTTDTVTTTVPRNSISAEGRSALLEYRKSLGAVGMLTVDHVRVTSTRFEACLHEYGVETSQHGLPRMHAGLVLAFEADAGEMKISVMELDIEFAPKARRNSTFADVGADMKLTSDL